MMKSLCFFGWGYIFVLLTYVFFCIPVSLYAMQECLLLPKKSIESIGERIYENECQKNPDYLVHWKTSEEHASCGIGHFIWRPESVGSEQLFVEQFPGLINFFKSKKIILPDWLEQCPPCPWKSRKEFDANRKSEKIKELRVLLEKTIPQQAEFIVERFKNSCKKLLNTQQRRKQFNRVAKNPNGVFALIDYAHFKGFGLDENERYKGCGWGLADVLDAMQNQEPSNNPVFDFVNCSKRILKKRVENAPRDERQWLGGWLKRLDSYAKKK